MTTLWIVLAVQAIIGAVLIRETRTSQVQMHEARAFFSELWWEL